MNSKRKTLLANYYKEFGIFDFVHNKTINHFELFKKLNTKKNTVLVDNTINSNLISKKKATQYNNEVLLKKKVDVIDSIKTARELADKATTLEELRNSLENFNGYLSIKDTANNTVFSDGNKYSKIIVVDDQPSDEEDLKGIPFCGERGELLDNMFSFINLNRKEHFYIINTVFWRPPGNRDANMNERDICMPFVEKHIALINPKLIICMGKLALNLADTNLSITQARQNIFKLKNNKYLDKDNQIKVVATFHPSYLLKFNNRKRDSLQDLFYIKDIIDNL